MVMQSLSKQISHDAAAGGVVLKRFMKQDCSLLDSSSKSSTTKSELYF